MIWSGSTSSFSAVWAPSPPAPSVARWPWPPLNNSKQAVLTINVPVVYMGRYEVVLRGDYP
jgi:hypothetical protein